ncbi:MAG: sigma-54 dependent transcriptional regulator [Gammaproteobacteria bacterium]|nr:sigma-54 dependent transcriptional regulator [Gammaproteobacteria bacterium]
MPGPSLPTVLVVDDDPDVLTAARLLLKQRFEVITLEDPSKIFPCLEAEAVDVCLLDMNFAIGTNTGEEGLNLMKSIRARDPSSVVVLMTAFGDLNTAVTAIKEGAADFILKPWQNEKLLATLNMAVELARSRSTVDALKSRQQAFVDRGPGPELIAGSPAMQDVMRLVDRAAPTDANVLILGENGTGKELIAREVYRRSARCDDIMLSVDLGAIPETLFESELFGHVKGAFTGAAHDRLGRFQAASGGTLFLDEVGNLPLHLQTKLLRVLEQREVTPVGADKAVSIDLRLICATNQSLEAMASDGRFRLDLLYRINTIQIELPPLRERSDDLPSLVDLYTSIYARKYQLEPKPLTQDALHALTEYVWPGNVRELAHAIERALILSEGDALGADDFMLRPRLPAGGSSSLNLEANERQLVETALRRRRGNISRAAADLGITRAALYRRMQKFDL